ncbi:hypothetical protein BN1708_001307, partial [Verticillium longisporum]
MTFACSKFKFTESSIRDAPLFQYRLRLQAAPQADAVLLPSSPRRLELVERHAHADVRVFHHLGELVKADLAVIVEIRLHDGLVDNLLELLVLEVAADHHLEHDEELAVADEAVAVNVVHLEGEPQLLLLVALGREGAEARDELLKVDVAAAVFVEDGDHSTMRGTT